MKLTVKNPVPVTPPPVYVLELTQDEANVLYQLTLCTMGNGPIRDVVDNIFNTLHETKKFNHLPPTEDFFSGDLRAVDRYPS